MTKKILMTLLVLALFKTSTYAQSAADQRTNTTRIADLLAQLPGQDAKQLNTAMLEIDQLDEAGLLTLIAALVKPGQGNNAAIEYALGGYSAYVTQNGKENLRSKSVNAYCKALAAASDKQVKSFLISQLELVGRDDAVSCLQAYLTDWQLADPASRALVKINSAAAQSALHAALATAQGTARLSVIEALGLSKTAAAVPALNTLASSKDAHVAKVALAALAQIADPSSAEVIGTAARQAQFNYGQDNATAALLLYADQLVSNGNKSLAENTVKQLFAEAKSADQVHVRTAALHILSRAAADPQSVLLKAMEDKDPQFRGAALKFAQPMVNDQNVASWIKTLNKSDHEGKAQIVRMLADAKAKAALPAMMKLMKNKNPELRSAAISGAGAIGQAAVIPDLYKVMRKGDSASVADVSQALLRMEGQGITAQLAAYLPKSKPEVQIALIQVLAARAASTQMDAIYALLHDKDAEVRGAAFASLKQMAGENDLPRLFTLLKETSNDQESAALQDAIISAMKSAPNQAAQVDQVLSELAAAPQERKQAYYKILAAQGGQKSLTAVTEAYQTGTGAAKQSALSALASWKDVASLPALLRIGKNTTDQAELQQAITGYLRLVRNLQTPEQMYLKLKDVMAIAKTDGQKQAVLRSLEQAKTFNALVLAGEYLDQPALQQAAANTVMNIALADKNHHGSIVKALLNKSINVIKGGDSEYQKEAMRKFIAEMPKEEGFVSIFNGKDLSGWKGLVANPIKRAKMDAKTLAAEQAKADELMLKGWKVEDGELRFQIHGDNLATVKKYADVEMLVDWKIIDDKKQNGDAGIYLRGTPQVQIWDTARVKDGAQVGSGGLYNNQNNPSKPLKVADNPLDEWNTFRIIMKGDRVTVYLNGELVTDNVILENYWDRSLPIFAEEQIELQAHGSPVAYRNIYIRELPGVKPFQLSATEKKEGYQVLFDGTNMHEWMGNTTDYVIEDGNISIQPKPGKGSGGNLFTKKQYSDFIFRFEFQLTPGANNGLGIRAPLEGDAAYEGMELQILDNDAPVYKDLAVYQYHGSVYGILAAKRGYLKPVGEWNYQEVVVKGSKIKVILNGQVILDGDISQAAKNGAIDGKAHPGLSRKTGHIGFLGHGSPVKFKNIRIKDLTKK